MPTPPPSPTAGHDCCAGKTDTVAATSVDPVCGMSVDPATTAHHAAHDGEDHFFCSAGCRTKFIADPDRYLGDRPEPEAAIPGAIYTCPMHPQIRRARSAAWRWNPRRSRPRRPSITN